MRAGLRRRNGNWFQYSRRPDSAASGQRLEQGVRKGAVKDQSGELADLSGFTGATFSLHSRASGRYDPPNIPIETVDPG